MGVAAFCGTVTGGKLHLDARRAFDTWLATLEGQRVTFSIGKERKRRSMKEAAYLFGVVYPAIAEHCGYEAYEVEEVHDAVMRELGYMRPEPNPLNLRQSIREMDRAAQSAYVDVVRRWAAKTFGLDIPDPS